jgi:hypothetical protein
MPEPEFYSAAFINSLRRNTHIAVASKPVPRATFRDRFKFLSKTPASRGVMLDNDGTWTVSERNPEQLLEGFDRLHLKPDIKLCAYVYKSPLGSNGFVYALPRSATMPDPGLCSRSSSHFLRPPVPPEAMDDPMSAIIGDGSALSYLQASVIARELREFGAGWHGLTWSVQFVLDQNPLMADMNGDVSTGPPTLAWKWLETVGEWRPHVSLNETVVTVVFYTSCEYYSRRIVENVDTYRARNYCFSSKEAVVADGGPGLCF